MVNELIDDPLKLIDWANDKIRKYEQRSEEARLKGDLAMASKYDFYLTKWADILQHAIREAHQEGRNTDDITKESEKETKKRGRFK